MKSNVIRSYAILYRGIVVYGVIVSPPRAEEEPMEEEATM